jgi:cytochrome c2
LTGLSGTWTPELLREFLRDPNSVANGTTMRFSRSLTVQEVADLTAYLETLN